MRPTCFARLRALAWAWTLVLLVTTLGGCAASAPTPQATPIADTARDDDFLISIAMPRTEWSSDEAIAIEATLTYVGPGLQTDIGGSGSGLVTFSIEHLDGPLDIGGASTFDCSHSTMLRGIPTRLPYTKSGGYDADGPHAAFYERFFREPELRLPAGRWRVRASTD